MSNFEKSDGFPIIGVGHRLPAVSVDNKTLCKGLDVTPEWIEQKTGIKRRYVASEEDTLSGYALEASQRAMSMAGVNPDDIDLIIVCTFSGDYIFPPLSAKLHRDLGVSGGQILDIQVNCTGVVTGLTCATDRMGNDPEIRNALVVGAEFCTRFISGTDPNTAIFLSDGAGALVVGRRSESVGIMGTAFFTDSSNYEAVRLRGGGASFPMNGSKYPPEVCQMEMNGLATWKQAITHLPPTMRKACQLAGVEIGDVDFFLFHQANLRMIEYIMRKMRVSQDKTYTNVADIGNSGAASLPIAISESVEKGLVKKDDIVLIAGVGAGFNFGASVWRWEI